MAHNYLANLGRFLPELITILTMMATMLMEATYSIKEKSRTWVGITVLIGLFVAFVVAISQSSLPSTFLFSGTLIADPFSQLAKGLLLLSGLGCIYINYLSKDIYNHFKAEYLVIMIGVILGGMLLIGAQNMLTFYLGIETLSILSYVMASLKKYNTKSNEAGIKYALYGGVAAGMMLYGMSHIYGVVGSLDFHKIGEMLSHSTLTSSQKFILAPSFLLFLVGVGFKIALAPFHMWAPDVYEGSPLPVTAFFSLVPKISGMVGIIHATTSMILPHSFLYPIWMNLLSLLAVVSMFLGNLTALNQKSIKRMLAYSGIAHAGYMIVGVIVNSKLGQQAILYYSFNYFFMIILAFFILTIITNHYGNDHFDRFKGLFFRYPFISICMMIVMFSLAGLPPFGGFVAKYQLLNAAISGEKPLYFLATMIVINSVISLSYYLRLVRLMVFRKPESSEVIPSANKIVNVLFIAFFSFMIMLLGLCWEHFAKVF